MKTVACTLMCIMMLAATPLGAQDIQSKLSGTTATQGFTVKDGAGTPLFTIRGDGKVGIGTTTPTDRLNVNTSSEDGVVSHTSATDRKAVVGYSDAAVGYGVWGHHSTTLNHGILGGHFFGVRGESHSDHPGIIANATHTSGTTAHGLQAFSSSPNAYAVVADNSSNGFGILGKTNASDKPAITGQNVSTSPSAPILLLVDGTSMKMKVDNDGGFVVTGNQNMGNIPATGAGARMMFYPAKEAFRAGNISGAQWDDANIGTSSIALGYSTTASGTWSTAMGDRTTASGDRSTATGCSTTASGYSSFATGYLTTASGTYSTAMGSHVTTNSREGAFVIGDHSVTNVNFQPGVDNRFYARFANGYALYTNSAATIGVKVDANQNSWSSISDSSRKNDFVYADGESMLRRFRILRLGSWNYEEQDSRLYRHYGPMAQEWFSAFGHDGIGTIGNDTTLASADVDGVLCIAVQALEKRTASDRDDIAAIQEQLTEKDREIAQLQQQLGELVRLVVEMHRNQDEGAPRPVQLTDSEAGQ
jgi:uncharacterized coiled-coil protein SlyX